MFLINKILNDLRNFWVFKVRRPWVVYGNNVHVQIDVEIFCPTKQLVLGDNVGINRRCVIISDVEIGNDFLMAPHCALLNRGEHEFETPGKVMFGGKRQKCEKIVIGNDVWIGFGSIILGGVSIGDGVVIAAGSLVITDVPAYSVVAGSPARVVRQRFSDEGRAIHEEYLKHRYEKT